MITKQQLDMVRTLLDAAAKHIAEQTGLESLKCGRCVYDRNGNFTMKVEGVNKGGVDKDAARYDSHHQFLDLPPRGATFKQNGRIFTICGLNTTATKVIAADLTGKKYVWKVDVVQALLAFQKKVAA